MSIQIVQGEMAAVKRNSIVDCVRVYKDRRVVDLGVCEDYWRPMLDLERTLSLGIPEYKLNLQELAMLGWVVMMGKRFAILDEDYCVEVIK